MRAARAPIPPTGRAFPQTPKSHPLIRCRQSPPVPPRGVDGLGDRRFYRHDPAGGGSFGGGQSGRPISSMAMATARPTIELKLCGP